jgi:hypothetical protein
MTAYDRRQQELFQKYEIYVDTVLNASDEILEISPTEALENLAADSAHYRIATICFRLTSSSRAT